MNTQNLITTDTINRENFYTAYFIDNDRTTIEVLLKEPNFGTGKVEVRPHIIEYDEEHPTCKELLEICDLEQLHENTWQQKKQEREDFVIQVKNIAESEGLYKKLTEKVDENLYEHIIKFLTTKDEEQLDKLFSWKIYLFENEIVKNSKNEKLKSAIRKSKSPAEALKYFISIWEENN